MRTPRFKKGDFVRRVKGNGMVDGGLPIGSRGEVVVSQNEYGYVKSDSSVVGRSSPVWSHRGQLRKEPKDPS